MNEDWKNNPQLSQMDKTKLDMLQSLAEQGSAKSPAELLPFLMSAAAGGRNGSLRFSPDEISAIIQVLKTGRSPEEAAKLDRIVNMMKMIR